MTEYDVGYDPVAGVAAVGRVTKSALLINALATLCLLVALLMSYFWPSAQAGPVPLPCVAGIAWLMVFVTGLCFMFHGLLTAYVTGLTWRKPEMKEARQQMMASLIISLMQIAILAGILALIIHSVSTSDLG
jgi:hypothetical protein